LSSNEDKKYQTKKKFLPQGEDFHWKRVRTHQQATELANFTSREVLGNKSSSSEDEERSIIGIFPEGPPCSNTGERGRCEEISDGDPGGGGDPNETGGGVLASLGDRHPSAEGEHERLVPLLSSIVSNSRAREGNPM
jgi:hypothetical protein